MLFAFIYKKNRNLEVSMASKDEKDEKGDSTEASSSPKKKMIIMIGGGVLLLVIIALTLFFTGVFDKEPVVDDASLETTTQTVEKEEPVEVSVVLYHALEPAFKVNLQKGNIRVMKIAISLVTGSEKVIDALKLHNPLLRNNILMILSSQDPELLKTAAGKSQLQLDIQTEVNEILANKKVGSVIDGVFFTELVMQ